MSSLQVVLSPHWAKALVQPHLARYCRPEAIRSGCASLIPIWMLIQHDITDPDGEVFVTDDGAETDPILAL